MLKINDVEIERVSSFKCLGILFDENMSWKCHTDMISNKLSIYTGIVNKLKHFHHIFSECYISAWLTPTWITHGIQVWGVVPTRLIKIQKRTIRTITCSKYNAHTEPFFQNTGHSRVKRIARYKRPEIWLQISPWNIKLLFLQYHLSGWESLL